MGKTLKLIENDPWLKPYTDAITGRHQHAICKEAELTDNGKQSLSDFASGYLYFGLHKTQDSWILREWAPNATHIYLIGTFNGWKEEIQYELKKLENGIWKINLPSDAIQHNDLYKLSIYWDGGHGQHVWYRIRIRIYSVLRCGTLINRINLKRKNLLLIPILY